MMEVILEPVVRRWLGRGAGIGVEEFEGESSGPPLSHLLWADNVWLFGRSLAEVSPMAH